MAGAHGRHTAAECHLPVQRVAPAAGKGALTSVTKVASLRTNPPARRMMDSLSGARGKDLAAR